MDRRRRGSSYSVASRQVRAPERACSTMLMGEQMSASGIPGSRLNCGFITTTHARLAGLKAAFVDWNWAAAIVVLVKYRCTAFGASEACNKCQKFGLFQ
jgi:hypothetical protein